jgi:hypothetical protein
VRLIIQYDSTEMRKSLIERYSAVIAAFLTNAILLHENVKLGMIVIFCWIFIPFDI